VKARFAKEIVARFHDRGAADAAEAEFEQRFRHGVLPEDMPEVKVTLAGDWTFAQILKLAKLVESTSEANRLIEQGGVKVDGERLSDRSLKAQRGRTYVIQVGKRKFARVSV
jgi:tyrosyl-tRNA synthetase